MKMEMSYWREGNNSKIDRERESWVICIEVVLKVWKPWGLIRTPRDSVKIRKREDQSSKKREGKQRKSFHQWKHWTGRRRTS